MKLSVTDETGEYVTVDGEKYYAFSVKYRYGAKTFTFEIYARTQEECLERIKVLKMNAELEGQIIDSFPDNWIGRMCVRIGSMLLIAKAAS